MRYDRRYNNLAQWLDSVSLTPAKPLQPTCISRNCAQKKARGTFATRAIFKASDPNYGLVGVEFDVVPAITPPVTAAIAMPPMMKPVEEEPP